MISCPTCGARRPFIRSQKDPAIWGAFLDAWWKAYGTDPVLAGELHWLPEAQVVHSSLTVFARCLGAAYHAGQVVDGRQVVLHRRAGTRKYKGRFIHRPATWALVESIDSGVQATPAPQRLCDEIPE